MKTPMEVADLIERAITALDKEGRRSNELIEAKANALSEYDRLLGLSVANLKTEGIATTLIDRIAKERTYKALYARIVAEETLKAHYSRLSQLESILNGFQSLNRYLQTVTRQENGI